MITLGLESSCDDTAAAILQGDNVLLSSIVSNQDMVHARFGGVVPELASRRHLESITAVVDEAFARASLSLSDIDLIAVTRGPGLIGSLLVGFSYAKSLSFVLKRPFVGVDHMAGHLLSAFLEAEPPSFPYIALIVSGGTSALFRVDNFFDYTLLGRTRDDAAGEAFDKVARHLELGYPGGPAISSCAESGDPSKLKLPRAWLEQGSCDFSFSGLKTAVLNQKCLNDQSVDISDNDLCASFQDAVVDVLVEKTLAAARQHNIATVVLGGGVSANHLLRSRMKYRSGENGCKLYLPSPANCTDNAAMIAFAGLKLFQNGIRGCLDDDVYSRSRLGQ